MEIENVRRASQYGQWAEMIHECRNSGQTVRAWCEDNGVSIKTYYYRLKRLRLIALGNTEKGMGKLSAKVESYPAFAELTLAEGSMPERDSEAAGTLAVTIKVARMTISIHNGAEVAVITNVIKAASEIS